MWTSMHYTCTLVTHITDISANLISKRVTWPPYYCLLSEAINRFSGASKNTWTTAWNLFHNSSSSTHAKYWVGAYVRAVFVLDEFFPNKNCMLAMYNIPFMALVLLYHTVLEFSDLN
jgi:hypothetical protein